MGCTSSNATQGRPIHNTSSNEKAKENIEIKQMDAMKTEENLKKI